jgi:hypothetical protein
MPKFPSFLEYMNDKGVVVDKPKTEVIPDYNGPEEKTPPDSKVPYKTPVANKAPAKGESGLAELGDDKLRYEPTKGSKEEVKADALKTVREYVDGKGKVLEKGTENVIADYKGPFKNAPEGKGAAPYVAKDGTNKKGTDKPLGELGDQDAVYEPNTESAPKVQTKTESFINKTKGMSIAEFTKYMMQECGCGSVSDDTLPFITAYTTGKFQPHPPEAIRYVTVLADKNQGILENLVSQIVSMGALGKLMKVVFDHPEAYEELTNLMSDEGEGPSRCKSFAGAMNNSYSKFLSDQDGLYESVSSPMGFDAEDMEGEEEKDLGDDEEMEDDMGDEEEDLGDEDMGDEDLGDEDMDDEDLGDEDMGEEGEEDFGDEDMGDEDLGDEEEHREEPRRLKKKFAHHHLLDAMRNHEPMLKAMRGDY